MCCPFDLSLTPWRAITLSARDGVWCLVDAIDYAWLSENNWNISWGSGAPWKQYAKRNVGPARDTLRMHRVIMSHADPDGYGEKRVVDHINGNGLDNRRENLRWCSAAQNDANRRARHLIPSLDDIVRDLLASLPAELQHLEEIPF